MRIEKILPEIIQKNDKKILLVVIDGVGGLPHPETGKTELETANIPTLDEFAKRGSCGLIVPVFSGITPGSGPGHIALFGYDPVEVQIGRGVLECLGIGMELGKEDIAIRGNFATIDDNGVVTDRRAGRIPTEENERLVARLSEEIKEIKGVKFEMGKEVVDIDFDLTADKKTATAIHLKDADTIVLSENDYVFFTNGSITESTDNGTWDTPAKLKGIAESGSWKLWKKLAKKDFPVVGFATLESQLQSLVDLTDPCKSSCKSEFSVFGNAVNMTWNTLGKAKAWYEQAQKYCSQCIGTYFRPNELKKFIELHRGGM